MRQSDIISIVVLLHARQFLRINRFIAVPFLPQGHSSSSAADMHALSARPISFQYRAAPCRQLCSIIKENILSSVVLVLIRTVPVFPIPFHCIQFPIWSDFSERPITRCLQYNYQVTRFNASKSWKNLWYCHFRKNFYCFLIWLYTHAPSHPILHKEHSYIASGT